MGLFRSGVGRDGGAAVVPASAPGAVSAAVGAGDPAYRMTGLSTVTPSRGLHPSFSAAGVSVSSGRLRVRLGLRAIGRPGRLRPLGATTPRSRGSVVTYAHPGVLENWEKGPLGLEQTFGVDARPGGLGPLQLAVGYAGANVRAALAGGSARLSGMGGALQYGGLLVTDARGRVVRSWLSLHGDRIVINIDDRSAAYPLRIDPFVEQAELTASDGASHDAFGWSVAVSGSTIVVGAQIHQVGPNAQQGAVYVYTAGASGWSQTAELTASDGASGDQFGTSVAINGSTILVGAPAHQVGANAGQGAVYVFTRSGPSWSQTAELTASDGSLLDSLGDSVAISGSTIVAGAPLRVGASGFPQGAAYVFTGSGSSWSQTAELTASDGAGDDDFGWSVAVDGPTVAVGAMHHSHGAVYVYTSTQAGWSQTAELTASDGAGYDDFGGTIAIAGQTIVVGAPFHEVGANAGQGAAYVFTGSGSSWPQTAELIAADGASNDLFGNSVAVDGSTIVAGAVGHQVGSNAEQGAAYLFTGSGSSWPQTTELTATNGASSDHLGVSVALSGANIIAGAIGRQVGSNPYQGAAYVFTDQTLTDITPPRIISRGLVGTWALATHGTWTGGGGMTYTYQWEICTGPAEQGCSPIPGATHQLSPRLTSTEKGSYLTIAVTATNSNGLTGHALATKLVS